MSVRVHLWGTRGSLPAPLDGDAVTAKLRASLRAIRDRDPLLGDDASLDAAIAALPFPDRSTFGGNSSCVQFDAGHAEYTVCDAGSGLRVFGEHVMQHAPGPQTYNLLLSHVHWDHIMGFPFFRPAYVPGNVIRIYGCHDNLRDAFARQHGPPSFPVPFDALGATIEFVTLEPGRTYPIGGFEVRAMLQQHPGGSYAFRLSRPEASVIYATDAEHAFRLPGDSEPLIRFFRDADLAIVDAMYSLGEAMTEKQDWGHSSNVVAVELSQAAGVRHLILFHHDPANDDRAIEAALHDARRFEEITRVGAGLRISAAYDGQVVIVPA